MNPQPAARRVTIAAAGKHSGESAEIAGWLYNLRRSGKICFPQVRDGTGILQCVAVKSALPEETFEALKNLTQESSLIVRGKLRTEARAPGGYELDVEDAEIVQVSSSAYPITPGTRHRFLWIIAIVLRSRRQHRRVLWAAGRSTIRIWAHGFVLVDTPIFTPAACEGTTTLFEVDYFEDEKVYLAQSGQLYNEATAMAFGKVYCFGPTFRAEKSKTRRHLTEFWMVETEMFADLEDVKRVGEELIIF
jgi:asparaginyl-tRNA synthetase